MKIHCHYTKERYRGTSTFDILFPWASGYEPVWIGYLDSKNGYRIQDPDGRWWEFAGIDLNCLTFKKIKRPASKSRSKGAPRQARAH